MDLQEFEIEKTWDAVAALGPRSTAAQLSSLTLLLTAGIWTFGAISSNEVEVPILGMKISSKIATEVAVLLGTASYFLVNILNSHRILLELRLQELVSVKDPAYKLGWNCKYPGVTTYLGNIRDRGKFAVLVSLILVLLTLLVPSGFVVILLVLGSRWWTEINFWLFTIPSILLLIFGVAVFCSAQLTPHSRS